jgi:four helix bundle protein
MVDSRLNLKVIIMSLAKSFRDLNVYKLVLVESRKCFEITHRFPKEERYSLTDQIRRSSRAVNALLAEAWARQLYEAAFINKLNESQAEAMETQAWLDHALECSYIKKEEHQKLDETWQKVGGMRERMMECSSQFCAKRVRG